MDVKRHNGNVLPKKPWTLVRGFLIFRGYACCATKTGKSPSSNNPVSDVRNASCTATPATILHSTSATRTRFQCSHPKQADLCMEKESHRITRGILCS